MIDYPEPGTEEPEPDGSVYFYIFMVVFWPVSILLGLIDFYFVPEHDLRFYNLLAGLIAGGIAVEAYRHRHIREDQAA